MSDGRHLVQLLAPGSGLHRKFWAGSIAGYARHLIVAVETRHPAVDPLLEATANMPGLKMYDEMSKLQALLMSEDEMVSFGRYMSPSALAFWLTEQVDLGASVGDTAAGIGILLAAVRASAPGVRVFGVEMSEDLMGVGRLAQLLSTSSSDYSWCRKADLLTLRDNLAVDSLVMSPPWVLRDNLRKCVLQWLAADSVYSSYTNLALFDICVPYVVESVARTLRVGGAFVATLPLRVSTAPEWTGFRSGGLFRARGVDVEMHFQSAPQEFQGAYPTQFVVAVGRRLA